MPTATTDWWGNVVDNAPANTICSDASGHRIQVVLKVGTSMTTRPRYTYAAIDGVAAGDTVTYDTTETAVWTALGDRFYLVDGGAEVTQPATTINGTAAEHTIIPAAYDGIPDWNTIRADAAIALDVAVAYVDRRGKAAYHVSPAKQTISIPLADWNVLQATATAVDLHTCINLADYGVVAQPSPTRVHYTRHPTSIGIVSGRLVLDTDTASGVTYTAVDGIMKQLTPATNCFPDSAFQGCLLSDQEAVYNAQLQRLESVGTPTLVYASEQSTSIVPCSGGAWPGTSCEKYYHIDAPLRILLYVEREPTRTYASGWSSGDYANQKLYLRQVATMGAAIPNASATYPHGVPDSSAVGHHVWPVWATVTCIIAGILFISFAVYGVLYFRAASDAAAHAAYLHHMASTSTFDHAGTARHVGHARPAPLT